MPIDVVCPSCNEAFKVREDLVGKYGKCRCGARILITSKSNEEEGFSWAPAPTSVSPTPPPAIEIAEKAASSRRFSSYSNVRSFVGFETDTQNPRFPALRMVARSYEILAIIVIAICAFALIVACFLVLSGRQSIEAVIFGGGLVFLLAASIAITLLFAAQMIRLALQVEQNTRDTYETCLLLVGELQQERKCQGDTL